MTTVVIGDNTGNDFAGTEDTHMKSNAATTNYATTDPIESTKYGVGDHTHALLKFSGLSNITPTVTVSSATLSFYCVIADNGYSGGTTQTISARRLLRNWDVATATWNVYSTGNSWTTAGGLSDGNDRTAAASATVTGNSTNDAAYKSFSGATMVSDTEAFINGTLSNYGWHFERTDSQNDTYFWQWSSEEHASGQRPYLTVVYTASGGSPTTNYLTLLGVGT